MTAQEILRALQAGKISLEDAKKALTTEQHARDLGASEPQPARPYRRKEGIAIVGMSGRYPDARNLTDFWDNLVQGKNAIREVPLSRWRVSDYYDPSPTA